jgi:serine/threonine protein kinase
MLIRDTVVQFKGIAEALNILHTKLDFRHGDLKPENILIFPDSTVLGTLKIADFGLAKQHKHNTAVRNYATTTKAATIQYESPQTKELLDKGSLDQLSRLTDIWSMVCIVLDHMVWILFGFEELRRFRNELRGENDLGRFFKRHGADTYLVHPMAMAWMDHITRCDPECQQDTATRDLLRVVKTKLLVIDTLEDWVVNWQTIDFTGKRIPAPLFEREMAKIFRKAAGNPKYLYTGIRRDVAMGPKSFPHNQEALEMSAAVLPEPLLHPNKAKTPKKNDAALLRGDKKKHYAHESGLQPRFERVWEFEKDNEFASLVLQRVGKAAMSPPLEPPKLCGRCRKLDFWSPELIIDDTPGALNRHAGTCDLCKLLSGVVVRERLSGDKSVSFQISGSYLTVNSLPSPVLSILRSAGKS